MKIDFRVLTIVISIVLAYQDKKNLEAEGYNTDKLGKPWQLPVYLSKRVKVLRHRGVYAVVWTLLFSLSILLTVVIAAIAFESI